MKEGRDLPDASEPKAAPTPNKVADAADPGYIKLETDMARELQRRFDWVSR